MVKIQYIVFFFFKILISESWSVSQLVLDFLRTMVMNPKNYSDNHQQGDGANYKPCLNKCRCQLHFVLQASLKKLSFHSTHQVLILMSIMPTQIHPPENSLTLYHNPPAQGYLSYTCNICSPKTNLEFRV